MKTNKCLLGWKWEARAVSAGKVILLEKEHKYERLVNYCKTLFEHMGLQAFFEAVIFMSVFGHQLGFQLFYFVINDHKVIMKCRCGSGGVASSTVGSW